MKKNIILEYLLKVVVVILLCIEIYPILWLFMSSMKTPLEFSNKPIFALPNGFHFENYINAWTSGKIWLYIKNSAITTCAAMLIIAVLSATAGFAIEKMKWKLSKTTLIVFLSGIMVPQQIVLIPLFMIYKKTGLLNSLLGLILVFSAFGLPLAIYLFTGFFKYVPDSIIEAAIIDGCNIYKAFFSIVLPVIKTAFVTVIMVNFFFYWNDLIFSMTFISKSELKTLQTGILGFTGMFTTDWGSLFAGIVMGVLPTIIIYIFLNKHVIKGMTVGAVKG